MQNQQLGRALLLIVIGFLSIGPADVTDVRAQEPEAQEEEPDRWGSQVGLSLNSSGGNEQLTILTTDLSLTHLQTESYELELETRFRYGRSDGDEVAQNLWGSLNADIRPAEAWSPFLFVTAEQDPFKRLDVRLNGGAGVKRTFYQDGWDEVSLSAAGLYSYENLEVADSLGDGNTETARWSLRTRGRHEVRDGTRFEQTVFFQPAWTELDDYLLEARTTGRVAVTQSVALTTTLTYQRDSTPAPEVGPEDWSVAVGLSLANTW